MANVERVFTLTNNSGAMSETEYRIWREFHNKHRKGATTTNVIDDDDDDDDGDDDDCDDELYSTNGEVSMKRYDNRPDVDGTRVMPTINYDSCCSPGLLAHLKRSRGEPVVMTSNGGSCGCSCNRAGMSAGDAEVEAFMGHYYSGNSDLTVNDDDQPDVDGPPRPTPTLNYEEASGGLGAKIRAKRGR